MSDDAREELGSQGAHAEDDIASFSSSLDEGPRAEVEYPLQVETPVPGCAAGGLTKTVLVEGRGPRPLNGARATVHYVGRLAETDAVFDSSRERGEAFTFDLGRGQVIRGWDKGVATMRVGETAVLKCRADYAYGAAGSPPKIPPNATLLFEVELLDWTQEQDISVEKDRSLMKSTLIQGTDYANPEFEAEVVADVGVYFGALTTEDVDKAAAVWEQKGWSFTFGVTPLPPFLEECLKSMVKAESAIFRVTARLVQEAHPEFNIPSAEERQSADISYTVTIHELKTITTWGLSSEKITEGNLRVEKGNAAFQQKDLALAERYYRRALEILGEYFDPSEKGEVEWQRARVRAMNNLSQVLLNSGKYAEVINFCEKIILINPFEKKALFRMAKALNTRHDWDEAIAALDKILREEPDNADAKALRMQISGERRAYNQTQKSIFQKMFS